MNLVVLTGRMTKDPELKYLPNGGPAVANFTMAVDKDYKKEGEERSADFINCVIWRKSAEVLKQYFSKGMKINIVGKLTVRSYENNEGQKRYITEVVVDRWEFGESKRGGGQGGSSNNNNSGNDGYAAEDVPPETGNEDDCDDIPF